MDDDQKAQLKAPLNEVIDGFGDAFWDEGSEGTSVTWIDMDPGDKKKIADLLEQHLELDTN